MPKEDHIGAEPPYRFGGMTHWELQRLADPPKGQVWWLPVYARFKFDGVLDPAAWENLQAPLPRDIIVSLGTSVQFDSVADVHQRRTGDRDLHFSFHLRVDSLESPDLARLLERVEVLHVGPPIALSADDSKRDKEEDAPRASLPSTDPATAASTGPWLGIIDDGIPFLHARFRSNLKSTRFRRVWLQAAGEPDAPVPGGPGDTPPTRAPAERRFLGGIILTEADINGLISEGDEAHSYARLNERLFGSSLGRRITNLAHCHGGQVLDLAAGADPLPDGQEPDGTDLRAVKLIAVQVPTESLEDQSSRRMESSILQGLRWIISHALLEQARPPLVINISLGRLAGPKDGRSFLERAIGREIDRYQSESGQPIRVVFAFGNSWRTRQVAAKSIEPGGSHTFDWRIQPDDRTSSFLELRARPDRTTKDDWPGRDEAADAAVTRKWASLVKLQVGLHAPDGTGLPPASQVLPMPVPGEIKLIQPDRGKTPIAAIYGDMPRVAAGQKPGQSGIGIDRRPLAVFAIGPTAGHDRPKTEGKAPSALVNSLAPAGRWTVTVKNTGETAVNVVLQIQRDDTPDGHRKAGRQSWFDAGDGWNYDAELRDWTDPGKSAVTRQGTHAAHGGLVRDEVYFVGAAQQRGGHGVPGPVTPARYTSEGAKSRGRSGGKGQPRPVSDDTTWRRGPTLSAIVDEGFALPGLRSIGTRSGATARLSGTSAAAPLLSRALLGLAIAGQLRVGTPQADELKRIGGLIPTATADRSRLGEHCMPG